MASSSSPPDLGRGLRPRAAGARADRIERLVLIGYGLGVVAVGGLTAVWTPLGGAGPQRFLVGSLTGLGGVVLTGLGLGHFWWPSLYGSAEPGTPRYQRTLRRLRIMFWSLGIAVPIVGIAAIVLLRMR